MLDPIKPKTKSGIGKIIGGVAVIVLGSLLGGILVLGGLLSKAYDMEGYHKNDFPVLIVFGGLVVVISLIWGVSLIISAVRQRKNPE